MRVNTAPPRVRAAGKSGRTLDLLRYEEKAEPGGSALSGFFQPLKKEHLHQSFRSAVQCHFAERQ
jgi:hypothetical protein